MLDDIFSKVVAENFVRKLVLHLSAADVEVGAGVMSSMLSALYSTSIDVHVMKENLQSTPDSTRIAKIYQIDSII